MDKKLVVYLTAGYPDISTTEKLIAIVEKAGADIIELGVPFSDPVADGKSIQYSSEMSLRKKTNLGDVLKLTEKIRRRIKIPFYIMSYINPIYRYGVSRFAQKCIKAGIKGVIIPDMPYDSSEIIKDCFENLDIVYMASSNTPEKRLEKIFSKSGGFVYVVSVLGVTGVRRMFSKETFDFIGKLKKYRSVPKYLGFGISSPRQIAKIKSYVDGVIIGSAIVEILRKNKKKTAFKKIEKLVKDCKKAILRED